MRYYKHLLLHFAWLLLLATVMGGFSSCVQDRVHNRKEEKNVPEGAPVTLTLGLAAGDVDSDELRAAGINGLDKVKDLRVLVFDGEGRFLYSSDAVMGNVAVAPDGDKYYFPDAKQDGITQQKTFQVTLVNTSQPRILHFIANYNWNKVSQDYFLTGTSEGEFVAALETAIPESEGDGNSDRTETAAFSPLWSRVEVSSNLANFNGSVIKMLRNYAKVTVELTGEGVNKLEDLEFTLHNIPTRGAVAPFYTDHYVYRFPFPALEPTLPSVRELRKASSASSWIREKGDFLLFEVPNDGDEKTSVIIRARRKVDPKKGEIRYYKADLVVLERVVGTARDVNRYLAVVRNNEYRVLVRDANTEGYGSMEEAIQAPAGNNLFTSVEMQDFGSVSDGALSLAVSPISNVFVRPSTLSFSVFYSGVQQGNPTSYNYIQYYPNWNPDTDPLLGDLLPVKDASGFPTGFTVTAKNMPKESIKEYYVDVVGLRQYNGQPIDGSSGATSPILRRVKLTLRPPFQFKAVLEPPMSGTDVRYLSFDLPNSLPEALFPFPIYIDAPAMTPDMTNLVASGHITIEYIDGKAVYKYMVKTPAELKKKRVSLPFRMNTGSAQNTQPIVLSSPYYENQRIAAEDISIITKEFDLWYRLPYTDANGYDLLKELPTHSKFLFQFDGNWYTTAEELESVTGIGCKYDVTKGKWTLSIPDIRAKDPVFMGKKLTISPINTILFYNSQTQYMEYTLSFHDYPSLQTLWNDAGQNNVASLLVTEVNMAGHFYVLDGGQYYTPPASPYLPVLEGLGRSLGAVYQWYYNGQTGTYYKVKNPSFVKLGAPNGFSVDATMWNGYYSLYSAKLSNPNGVVQNGLNFTFSGYSSGFLVTLKELEQSQDIYYFSPREYTSRS